ncbi:MAG: hypothetical protein OXD45_09750 [Rhodobacteraceae bacterium]|nr:hypothetical protein [Paracoccaceae bacterium]
MVDWETIKEGGENRPLLFSGPVLCQCPVALPLNEALMAFPGVPSMESSGLFLTGRPAVLPSLA